MAGHLALKKPFNDVYKFFLENGFTKNLAFQRTFRLKRGFEDTSSPGCFAKEAVYYEGMIEVKNYLDKDGDVKKLFAGKVGFDDFEYVPVPKDVIIPSRLQTYLDKG